MSIRTNRLHLARLEDRVMPSLTPVGPEFRVNVVTQDVERFPGVGCDADGNFVVVYHGYNPDLFPNADYGVIAHRYSADGTSLGNEIGIAETSSLAYSTMSMISSGQFVATWEDYGMGNTYRVFTRVYAADMTPLSSIINVSQGNIDQPDVAMFPDGHFVITWGVTLDANYTVAPKGRLYSSNGVPMTNVFNLDDAVPFLTHPVVAGFSDGSFVTGWGDLGFTAPPNQINPGNVYLRKFDDMGVPVASAAQLPAVRYSASPGIASLPNGDCVLGWLRTDSANTTNFVVQRFDSAAMPLGTSAIAYPGGFASQGSLAVVANDLAVLWCTADSVATQPNAYMRLFSPDLTQFGAITQINSFVGSGTRERPEISSSASGDAVIAWQSHGQDGEYDGVYAQRFIGTVPQPRPAVFNNGNPQRSSVKTAQIDFHRKLILPSNQSSAFVLTGPTGVLPITVDTSASTPAGAKLKLTFPDLADGRYTLRMLAAEVTDSAGQHLDGNGDGIPGDDYVVNFHKLTGDFNGDARVDGADFLMFRLSYNTTGPSDYDLDGDGLVNASDFLRFRLQFLKMV